MTKKTYKTKRAGATNGVFQIRISSAVRSFVCFILCLLSTSVAQAHPGSGIVVDRDGQVYFTDTGKGVWKIDVRGKLIFIPSSRFHWMALDPAGHFSASAKSFGQYFERVALQSATPTLVLSSDFPIVIGKDGNMYYADTRPHAARIVRRTPQGKEEVIASNKIFEFVSGIAVGADGSLYITEASNAHANTIRKITMNGTISVIATYTAKDRSDLPLETVPSYCRGLAVDSGGNIYVAATGNRSVLKISPKGKITTMIQMKGPWTPTGVAERKGVIYILEWHDVTAENLEVRPAHLPRVRKIGIDGKVTTLATISRNTQ